MYRKLLSPIPLISYLPDKVVIAKSNRLTIRHLHTGDAAFILELVNQPAWLDHIGDKNVHSIGDAVTYIQDGPLNMYQKYGFGLFLVENKSSGKAIGICGLIKRDTLPLPDIGFALLPDHWGKGYALEAAMSVMEEAFNRLRISQILAITSVNNFASIRLLGKLGFEFQEKMQENDKDLNIYVCQCERLSTI